MEPLTIVVYLLSATVLGIYLYAKWSFGYWKRLGIYYVEPEFPYGNIKNFVKRKEFFGDTFTRYYKEFRAKGLKGAGLYMFFKPTYMAVDLEVVKSVLQKDFGHFMNHGRYVNKKIDPLSAHLFNLENDEWRNLRVKLTPTFTSAKMKMMFQTFVESTSGLVEVLKDQAIIQDPVDIKEIVSRFTTDIIGSCAFGINCNSLKNPNSEFREFGKKIFQAPESFSEKLKNILIQILPKNALVALRIKKMDIDVESFFMNVVQKTVNYREKNNIQRKDFMQLLLQLKNEGNVEDDDGVKQHGKTSNAMQTLSMTELAAQCFVFFIAGFETSATTMTFALLEMALNQDIQDKLRTEIDTVLKRYNGVMSYEAVMEMSYLDKVVHETLRKHSAAGGVFRECNRRYKIPGTNAYLDPGHRVHIPIQGIHNDPEYYPEPEKFDPERFSEENKSTRPSYSFLAFGEGPRNCIGARFGLLQSKVGLLTIIKNFKVTLNSKTRTPIKYEPSAFITSVDGGVWINVTQIG